MRRMLRLLGVIALLVATTVVVATPAAAGGPTSVILVAPYQNRATALYYSDPEYQELMAALGEQTATAAEDLTQSPGSGRYVTATWLIHDVTIWRTDRILLGATVPLVHTVVDIDGSGAGGRGSTHEAADPAALNKLLNELLLAPDGASPAAGDVKSQAVTVAIPTTVTAATTVTAPAPQKAAALPPGDGTSGGGWWWGIGGLVVGALLAGLALRPPALLRRRTAEQLPWLG